MEKLTIKDVVKALEEIFSSEEQKPYKKLGGGLYELPGNVICNKKGLKKYLNGQKLL